MLLAFVAGVLVGMGLLSISVLFHIRFSHPTPEEIAEERRLEWERSLRSILKEG